MTLTLDQMGLLAADAATLTEDRLGLRVDLRARDAYAATPAGTALATLGAGASPSTAARAGEITADPPAFAHTIDLVDGAVHVRSSMPVTPQQLAHALSVYFGAVLPGVLLDDEETAALAEMLAPPETGPGASDAAPSD